jgi:hypothetical protein
MALCISAANCGKLMTRRVKALSLSQPKMHFWPNYMHRTGDNGRIIASTPEGWAENQNKTSAASENRNLELKHVTLHCHRLEIYLYCYLIPPRDLPRRRANAQHERVTHPIALGRCASPKYFKCLACRYAEASKKQIV